MQDLIDRNASKKYDLKRKKRRADELQKCKLALKVC